MKTRDAGRHHGLDWLRAGATLLVVALHAGIAYQVAPLPGLVWSTRDPQGSLLVDFVTWWIDGFIMPLFFAMSGLVAFGLMDRRGPAAFLKHRTARLLGPFAVGCLLILPLDLYAWLLGWAADGKLPLRKLQSLKVDGALADGLWGSSHLWFLQYLWLYCVVATGMVWLRERRRRDHLSCSATGPGGSSEDGLRRPRRLSVLRTRYADDLIVVLLGISATALWWEPQLVIGFRHSWFPLPANVLFYAPWFLIGWLMAAHTPRVRVPRGEWRVAASVVIFTVLWPLIHQHVAEEFTGEARMMLAGLFVLHAWLAVTGWLGVCVRRLDREPPGSVKYIAAASFWIYLFHHPVVGLTHVTLSPLAISSEVKFSLSWAVGVVLSLLTYEAFVRRTTLGVLLNGRRDVGRPSVAMSEAVVPAAVVPAALDGPAVKETRRAA